MKESKLLSPWSVFVDEQQIDANIFVRWRVGGNDLQPELWGAWVAYYGFDKSFSRAIHYIIRSSHNRMIDFSSIQEGQNLIDKELTDLGYILCDQEQWDKYSLLI
jgi:hypothetical protein